jgi:isocitrate dehydrogenase
MVEKVGADDFIAKFNPDELGAILKAVETEGIKLSMITNRGIKVWPEGFKETFCTDHWRCRFKPVNAETITKGDIVTLMDNAVKANVDTIKTENLYAFDGKPAYSLGQGQ